MQPRCRKPLYCALFDEPHHEQAHRAKTTLDGMQRHHMDIGVGFGRLSPGRRHVRLQYRVRTPSQVDGELPAWVNSDRWLGPYRRPALQRNDRTRTGSGSFTEPPRRRCAGGGAVSVIGVTTSYDLVLMPSPGYELERRPAWINRMSDVDTPAAFLQYAGLPWHFIDCVSQFWKDLRSLESNAAPRSRGQ